MNVREFLAWARQYYDFGQSRENIMSVCALGGVMIAAIRLKLPGHTDIGDNRMPGMAAGARMLMMLNPKLSREQAQGFYRIIINRNDCNKRRSRAWSAIRKAALTGHLYRFDPVGDGSGRRRPVFTPLEGDISGLFEMPVDATTLTEEVALETASPDYGWPAISDSLSMEDVTALTERDRRVIAAVESETTCAV